MAILLSPMWAAAVEKAPRITDREIIERLTRLKEGQKVLNKRIDDLRAEMNGKFDDLRAEMNGKFDDLRAEMNGKFGGLRAEMRGRFDDVNMRINDLRAEMNGRFNTLQRMLWLFISISLVILGFVLRMQWQMQKRQTSLETTLSAHKEELIFLKDLVKKLLPPKGVL